MSSFTPQVAAPDAAPPDPTKHVKYTLGMVLGVDDFTQEFAYLTGRDQWMARDLIGYGTACGLQVTLEADTRGPRVVVTPGVAVTPRGQLVRIPATQCAYLNDWLKIQQQQKPLPSFISELSSAPTDLTLYVVLCYRDCPTDQVPIPGEPCRDESDAIAASRLTDDFRLELYTTPPDQREEDALSDFVDWLQRVEFTDDLENFTPLQDFVDEIRKAAHLTTSSPPEDSPPDFMYGSPPASLLIPRAQACEYLHTAFRIWTTELRSIWAPNGCGNPPAEECLLLAELHVPIKQDSSQQWLVDDITHCSINEERRPYLVHLRMLQEWLLCGIHQQDTLDGDVTGKLSNNIVERIRNISVAAGTPSNNQVLTYNSSDNQWQARDLPTPPSTLLGDVTGDMTNNKVERIQAIKVAAGTPSNGQVLTFNQNASQWQASNIQITLAGDVTGPISNAKVSRLQNALVSSTTQVPTAGQVLTVQSNGQWQAASPAASGNAVEHPAGLPSYQIVAAGMVRGDGTAVGPVYNALQAKATANGELTAAFNGYQPPDQEAKFQYIVKVLPVFDAQVFAFPLVSFARFDKGGFVLHVSNQGDVVKQDTLTKLVFMIEVSQFFAK